MLRLVRLVRLVCLMCLMRSGADADADDAQVSPAPNDTSTLTHSLTRSHVQSLSLTSFKPEQVHQIKALYPLARRKRKRQPVLKVPR
jgi:hypothetical protein